MGQDRASSFAAEGKGTYILILRLDAPTRITIGKLGTFDFPEGWYAYVGSAFGAGGLRGRLKHHLSPLYKPHWHVDYLRQVAVVIAIWHLTSETSYEHVWADRLRALPEAAVPVPRFGASDCDCPAHLFHFACSPDIAAFVPLPDLRLLSIF